MQPSSPGLFMSLHAIHLIETLGPGGAERLLHTNLKYLDSSKIQSTVITLFSGDTHWEAPIQHLGVRTLSLECSSRRETPFAIPHLARLLKEEQPDLLHTHLFWADQVGRIAGRIAGTPVVSSVHLPSYEWEAWSGIPAAPLKRAWRLVMERWTTRLACLRLIAVSEYVRQSAHHHLGFPLDRIDLIYNPVDLDELRIPTSLEQSLALQELGLPEDSLLLLNVGRVHPQKGLIFAIRALPALCAKYPGLHLLSAGATGDGKWARRLLSEAAALGVSSHFHMLGPRTDIPALLRTCHVFVFPSLYEGLGIAILEAMASGCACVAANTGPLTEIVQHGVNGLLTSPGNVEGLTEAVASLLDDPSRRRKIGQAAKDWVTSRFHPAKAARDLINVYDLVHQHDSNR